MAEDFEYSVRRMKELAGLSTETSAFGANDSVAGPYTQLADKQPMNYNPKKDKGDFLNRLQIDQETLNEDAGFHSNDPMSYSTEELMKAIEEQTLGEITFDEAEVGSSGTDSMMSDLVESLYEDLKGVHPNSREAESVIERIRPKIEHCLFYPLSHNLLESVEYIVAAKFRDDPRPYVKIVADALGTPAARNWLNEFQRYR